MAATDIIRDNALLSMTSPLGQGVLIPASVELEEALSEPFVCSADVVSVRDQIDPDDLLHQPVCLTLKLTECPARHVHGLVRRFGSTGPLTRGMFGYRMEIVPALWFLTQTEDCRIFENKATKDIVQTILSEHGVRFTFRVGNTPPRPLTVQYNETDLNFVMRLMAEEGWFYLFRHEASSHTMIITESNTSFNKVPDGTVGLGSGEGLHTLSEWHQGRATAHGKVMLGDYDPEHPSTKLSGETATTARAAGATERDPFHWPARALQSDQITQRTRQHMEAAEAEAALAEGAGFNPNFFAGGRIQVSVRAGDSKEFLLAGVSHRATDETWWNGPNPPSYRNSFKAFPSALPWRPAQTIKRPRMEGLHSAIVIGPEGQEIHTDELGRVKLRFRWDRRGDATPGGAVWVRVMQAWSGANGGWTFIPRVGTEVGVSFLDGDPDRPIVVGQIHNGEQHPPWTLPDQKTRSGLRTRSTPHGGDQNCSEFWFDDKKGSEMVHLHAEKDLTVEVENDAKYEIDQNRTTTIKQGNDTTTVERGNRAATIKQGNDTTTVDQGNRAATVRQGNDTVTVQMGNRTVDVPMGDHTIKSNEGNIAIKTALGAVSIEAMQSLTLKVGQSTVTLDQMGVTIKGMTVKVEGQMMTSIKAPIIQIDADGMLKASGGMMMLN
jgi:type VI secretion system secreted protein VgrG